MLSQKADRIFTILMGDKVGPSRREVHRAHSAELDFASSTI